MRETTALTKTYDSGNEELINESGSKAEDVFLLPTRNWNNIIDDYNASHKKKFQLSALECRTVVEYAKRSVPPQVIFEAVGISKARYNSLASQADDVENQLADLNSKESLTNEEYEFFQDLLRHPVRILVLDVARAVGISKIVDWEKFNANADIHPEVQFAKMKARFRDYFADKGAEVTNQSVTIVLGGNFVENL